MPKTDRVAWRPSPQRVLGVDPGSVRIGLALSDDEARLALPLGTVPRGKSLREASRAVRAAVEAHERACAASLAVIVIGLPLRLDGSEGEAARAARALGAALGSAFGVVAVPHTDGARRETPRPGSHDAVESADVDQQAEAGDAGPRIVFWDERLTTVAAQRALREMQIAGRARRAVVDQAAATILLQSYLDAQQSRDERTNEEAASWAIGREGSKSTKVAERGDPRAELVRGGRRRPKRSKR